MKLCISNDKILIFAKNIVAFDTIIYYQKYINYKYEPNSINIALYKYDPKKDNYTAQNILEMNKVKHINFDNLLNNNGIRKLEDKIPIKKFNFVFIDFNILIKELEFIRPYNFAVPIKICFLL